MYSKLTQNQEFNTYYCNYYANINSPEQTSTYPNSPVQKALSGYIPWEPNALNSSCNIYGSTVSPTLSYNYSSFYTNSNSSPSPSDTSLSFNSSTSSNPTYYNYYNYRINNNNLLTNYDQTNCSPIENQSTVRSR